jgi:drug/metabolite transporter (DMT)-like permease
VSDLAEVLPGGPLSHRPNARLGYALVIIAAICFATNATVSKSLLLSGIEATRLAQLRVTAAFIIIGVILALTRPSAFKVKRAEWPALIAFGLIGVTFTQLLYFMAISRLPISIALLLEFTAPIIVALFWKFGLHRHVGRGVWLGLVLALVGLALVAQVWSGFSLNPFGVLCGLGAATALAVYYISGDKAVSAPFNRDSVSVTMWGFAIATAFWAIVQGKNKAIPKTPADRIIAGAVAYARTSPDPQFVPMPMTWLRGARWEAQYPMPPAPRASTYYGEVVR